MNRCVQIIDQDGANVLPSASRVVRVGATETFRDVFRRLAPDPDVLVTCIQLKRAIGTAQQDAAVTKDLDESVTDVCRLLASCQGFDPTTITYVATPVIEAAAGSNDSVATQTEARLTPAGTDEPDDSKGCSGGLDHAVNADGAAPGSSESKQQQLLTWDEVSTWYDDPSRAARAAVLVDFLADNRCGFHADEPRQEAFTALEGILQLVTPICLGSLHLGCSVAESQLRGIAEARHPGTAAPPNGTGSEQVRRLVQNAIAQAINNLHSNTAVNRVFQRGEWHPVRCLLSALRTAATHHHSGSAALRGPAADESPPRPDPSAPSATASPTRCVHCGTNCHRGRQKRHAPADSPPPAVPPPKATKGDAQPERERRDAHAGACSRPPPKSARVLCDSVLVAPGEECCSKSVQPLRRVLSHGAEGDQWQPSMSAIINMVEHWVDPHGTKSARMHQMSFFRLDLSKIRKSKVQFAFPYGVASVRNGRRKDWYAWRLPALQGNELTLAHDTMTNLLLGMLRQAQASAARS